MQGETGPETIQRVLSAYQLGQKLRQLRLRKKIALVDLGKHTGLSPSMISQLENGKMIPTLPTLARIAMVFDVGLEFFFGAKKDQKQFSIVRAEERMRFPERADIPSPAYFFECLAFSSPGKGMQAYLADFPPRGADQLTEHFHDGWEFLFVLEGSIVVHFEGQDYEIKAGDSLHMDSSGLHGYRGAGNAGGKAVVITIQSERKT
jgi:transcriptional regulator with XRE-family HTH domain